jgi:HSP20 family protein
MLQFDPFRDFSRLASEMLSGGRTPHAMPMDAYRLGDHYVVEFDLPGIDTDSLELTTENNTLTVRAERKTPARGSEKGEPSYLTAERPRGCSPGSWSSARAWTSTGSRRTTATACSR